MDVWHIVPRLVSSRLSCRVQAAMLAKLQGPHAQASSEPAVGATDLPGASSFVMVPPPVHQAVEMAVMTKHSASMIWRADLVPKQDAFEWRCFHILFRSVMMSSEDRAYEISYCIKIRVPSCPAEQSGRPVYSMYLLTLCHCAASVALSLQ